MNRVKNFNAGPAALPLPALERAREEFLDFAKSGMSVMEHSHRGKEYEACHDEAIALLKELLAVPDTHEVLFVQGGASQLFAQIPMNLVQKGGSADYVVTGAWSEKAVSEAKLATAMLGGASRVAFTTGTGEGKEKSYVRAPAPGEVKAADGAAYLHLTSQRDHPRRRVRRRRLARLPRHRQGAADRRHVERLPLEEDRRLEVRPASRRGPENIGPSGVVVMVISKALIEQGRKDIPRSSSSAPRPTVVANYPGIAPENPEETVLALLIELGAQFVDAHEGSLLGLD